MFSILRPYIFSLDPEVAHDLAIKSLKANFLPKSFFDVTEEEMLETKLFNKKLPNPIGLAAGFDKNAAYLDELEMLGFGFVEIGTVTPKPQAGNAQPRLFRIPDQKALINRMGFNNGGVEEAVARLKQNKGVLIGGNIGKNKVTPNEDAVDDYKLCFEALFDYVDYFVVNVSSPNTPNLRALQDKEPLTNLLKALQVLNFQKPKTKPILLKIAPDLTDEQLLDIIDIVAITKIDGVISTNTTISRNGLNSNNQSEAGGLSGKPLTKRSTEVIRFLAEKSNKAFTIIGVGGIHSADDALEKLEAGADLLQLYTGFIYEGPKLIKDINKALLVKAK